MGKGKKHRKGHEAEGKPVSDFCEYGIHTTRTENPLPHTAKGTSHITPTPLHEHHNHKKKGNYYKKRKQEVIHA